MPNDDVASTYAFVATSVGFIVVPSIVIILKALLPLPSRRTRVLAVSVAVAERTIDVALATFEAFAPPTELTTVAPCVPVMSPMREPVKFVAFVEVVALIAEMAVVAEVALPFNVAVIVPAEKFPRLSRATIVDAVFVLVAVVAEFATLPMVVIVANFESTMPAPIVMSAFVISAVETFPFTSVRIIPTALRLFTRNVPEALKLPRSCPFVRKERTFAIEEIPLVVLPANVNAGDDKVPDGNCNVPVIVSPIFRTLFEALPTREAKTVPNEALPLPSRTTMVDGTFVLVAKVVADDVRPSMSLAERTTSPLLPATLVTREEIAGICDTYNFPVSGSSVATDDPSAPAMIMSLRTVNCLCISPPSKPKPVENVWIDRLLYE